MRIDDREDLEGWLRFERASGLGIVKAHALLSELGAPSRVFDTSQAALAKLVGESLAKELATPPDAELRALIDRSIAWAAEDGHCILTIADAAYPQQLLTIADPPLLLFVVGNPRVLAKAGVAIVGSRNATAPGLGNARQFAHTLAGAGQPVVSGLALGIDAAAHEGALDARGETIAVVGTGADITYPAQHKALAARIVQHGALVSEQPLGMPAIAHNFPKRNRIIAGLARGVLVVEAAARSGSLITARLAAEQGREVFAIPGSIHSPLAKGCHLLIKQGAKLVDDARDILDELGGVADAAAPRNATADVRPDELPAAPPWLADAGFDPFTIDELAARTGAGVAALQAALLDWELDGRIARLPGGRWQRLGR